MKKLLLGMGYFTWIVCNLAVVYGLGNGVLYILQSKSIVEFLTILAIGMILIVLLSILSILCFALVAMLFNDEKVEKKIDELINLD